MSTQLGRTNPLSLTDPLPEGCKDRSVRAMDRMREWLSYLRDDQSFTFIQAARRTNMHKDMARQLLNKLQDEGVVRYVGHECSRTWRKVLPPDPVP